jgi:hypothetical protein
VAAVAPQLTVVVKDTAQAAVAVHPKKNLPFPQGRTTATLPVAVVRARTMVGFVSRREEALGGLHRLVRLVLLAVAAVSPVFRVMVILK